MNITVGIDPELMLVLISHEKIENLVGRHVGIATTCE
jgi:hypothetical protein